MFPKIIHCESLGFGPSGARVVDGSRKEVARMRDRKDYACGDFARRVATRYNAGDAQTIAYVAMGAHAAILSQPGSALPTRVCDRYEGEAAFIDHVIQHAVTLDYEADKRDNDLTVMFAYEIAEPFGKRYALALINGTGESAADIIAELFAENDKESQA
jgi:hypothetical protein